MSLDKVIEEILERGEREAKEILDSADLERERALSDVRTRSQELLKEREVQAEDQASRERLREIARAELESKRIGLRAQKEVLDEILSRAKRRLRESASRKDILEALVRAHRKELEDGIVLCNKADASAIKGLVNAEVRDELSGIGGLIIESKDGSRRTNLTYESFLEDLWEDVVKEVAAVLWRED